MHHEGNRTHQSVCIPASSAWPNQHLPGAGPPCVEVPRSRDAVYTCTFFEPKDGNRGATRDVLSTNGDGALRSCGGMLVLACRRGPKAKKIKKFGGYIAWGSNRRCLLPVSVAWKKKTLAHLVAQISLRQALMAQNPLPKALVAQKPLRKACSTKSSLTALRSTESSSKGPRSTEPAFG